MLARNKITMAKPAVGRAEFQAVRKVLKSGNLAQGLKVSEFESAFAHFVEERTCVALNSGTSALHLALLAMGIGPGDEVIVPSFTFAATANSVRLVGAKPVWADIELGSYCIDPRAIEAAITSRTRAIVPVHLYGHPADMPKITSIAKKHNLQILEDAAQAHLAQVEGKAAGTWGAAGAFSFYPTKNMTTGEGGLVTSSDSEIVRKVKLLRNQGMAKKYENEIVGYNNRMTDIAAAIGLVQLDKLESLTARRRENAAFFNSNLINVVTPVEASNVTHVYHQYTIRIEGHDRSKIMAELAQKGIPSDIYYPTPVHRLPSFRSNAVLPVTEKASQSVLALPVHPRLSGGQLERIVKEVNAVAKAGS